MTARIDQPIAIPTELNYPPRMIHDENGEVVGIILAYSDYQTFLRILARFADWEKLPPYLQNAIDNMLADEAEAEGGEARPLRELLAEAGELS
ncbi:MAG: hypothetical protein HY260_06585 [Chloroflexi bacterium]|nr:hypothetical protein [Chloroflexota bacterium]